MNKKKLVILWQMITIVSALCIFLYLLFAFTLFEINPSGWDYGPRLSLSLLVALVVIVGGAVSAHLMAYVKE